MISKLIPLGFLLAQITMEDFADIRANKTLYPWWIWLIPVAVVLLALLLVLFLRRRKQKSNILKPVPVIPADETALKALQSLREHASELEPEQFAVSVTGVVRTYIEATLRLPASEQTSEEFLHAFNNDERVPQELKEPMPSFLEQMDLVKFARQRLEIDQRERFIDQAEKVVIETKSILNPPLATKGGQSS